MLYFLYESSLGYSVFKLNKLDKLSLKDPKIISQIENFGKFKTMVSLEGTHFFHGHNVAFENVNALKNGELPADLITFLRENLPEHNKKTLKLVI